MIFKAGQMVSLRLVGHLLTWHSLKGDIWLEVMPNEKIVHNGANPHTDLVFLVRFCIDSNVFGLQETSACLNPRPYSETLEDTVLNDFTSAGIIFVISLLLFSEPNN